MYSVNQTSGSPWTKLGRAQVDFECQLLLTAKTFQAEEAIYIPLAKNNNNKLRVNARETGTRPGYSAVWSTLHCVQDIWYVRNKSVYVILQ